MNEDGKTKDVSSTWSPTVHMGDSDETSGSWPGIASATWGMVDKGSLSVY